MARLSKNVLKLQQKINDILEQDILSRQDKLFVYEHFNEAVLVEVNRCAAFFTPLDLAWEVALEVVDHETPQRVLDLCAGIGMLAFSTLSRNSMAEIVCVEQNPEFVRIGRKLLPEAKWICCSLEDTETLKSLGIFDVVVSNPPYGVVPSMKDVKSSRYTGELAHFKAIDIASNLGNYGVFLIPQSDAGFKLSGVQCYERCISSAHQKFFDETGIEITPSCGIDTTAYTPFKNTKIVTEITTMQFPVDHCFKDDPLVEEQLTLSL
jgi:predicted RNA methylase